MKAVLHPVPIACLIIAVAGAALSSVPAVILGLLGVVATAGILSARSAQRSREADPGESLSSEGRILLRPVKRLADDVCLAVESAGDNETIRMVGPEAAGEAKRLLDEVARSLHARDEIKKLVRGRFDAEKQIGDVRMRLEFAAGAERESLEAAIAARTAEIAHYDELQRLVAQIEVSVSQAEAALSEMKARLAVSASTAQATVASGSDLRETLGRLKSLSDGYEEVDNFLKGS